jgi:hypothetical protein
LICSIYVCRNKTVDFKYFDGIVIWLIILVTASLSLVMGIISIEMTIQKNPISGIWDWNFGQVMVMVAVTIDIIDTFKGIIGVIGDDRGGGDYDHGDDGDDNKEV